MDGYFILSSARFSYSRQCVDNPQHLEFLTPSKLKPLQCYRISSNDTLEHWKPQWDLEMSTRKDQKNPNLQASTIYLPPWNLAAFSCWRTQTDTQFFRKKSLRMFCIYVCFFLFSLVCLFSGLTIVFLTWFMSSSYQLANNSFAIISPPCSFKLNAANLSLLNFLPFYIQ